jgi:Zn-dependent protease
VDRIKNIFLSAYFAAWLAAFILVPLIGMHGYRQWWLVTLYVLMAVTAVAGSINHYRIGRRNRKS